MPRNAASTWRTAGQKSQPLNFLFGDKAGWRGGLLNIKSWRERGADKNIAEQFLTAQDKGVPFSSERDKQNLFMTRVFGMKVQIIGNYLICHPEQKEYFKLTIIPQQKQYLLVKKV